MTKAERDELRRIIRQRSKVLRSDIDARRVELERREVTLLEELAVGTLESAEARDFLARIPTVGELVPSYRLAQITDMEQQ